MLKVFIGWDTREAEAWRVLEHSIRRHSSNQVLIQPLIIGDLQYRGLYDRPTIMKDGRLFDVVSEAPMSTEFAITRFLTPLLAGGGYALFMDCDMLNLTNISDVLRYARADHAVSVVKHTQDVLGEEKMDGQKQLPYPRKNWSSFMLFNCDHPANKSRLTLDLINTATGRDLHRFCWLADEEIGELPLSWNWLEGYSGPTAHLDVIHYTRGGPWMKDWQDVDYADMWLREQSLMRNCIQNFPIGDVKT